MIPCTSPSSGDRVTSKSRVLSAACTLILVGAGAAMAPATQAAASINPLPGMLKALSAASSFQLVYTAHSSQKPPAMEKLTLVLTRRDGSTNIHTVDAMRPSGAGDLTIVESVSTGSTVCNRVAFNVLRGKFACGSHPKQAASLVVSAEPIYGLVGAGATVTFSGAASRVIAGRTCTGYAFSVQLGKSHGKGTVYVAPSGIPCEEDAVTFGLAIGPSNGKAMETITSTTVWSRVDDAQLTMPSGVLPAASAAPGTLIIQPPAAKVGQSVTLSGRTAGGELFLPPVVQMGSLRVHTVSRSTEVQCGGTAAEPVAFGQVVNGGPYIATGAPAGQAWQVTFRVPAQLSTYAKAVKGNNGAIATPAGAYRLIASFGPAFFCPAVLPKIQGQLIETGNLTVLS
jgi:hypothetical protein